MRRRRDGKRRKREERRQRSPEEIEAARAQQEAEETATDSDDTAQPDEGISWTGIAGGLLGALPLAFLGVEAVFDPNVSNSAGLFAVVSLVFVPAIWVSMRRSNVRRAVQRGTVVACLVLAFFGALVVGDVILPTILLPATTLLAIASGLVFQRS